MPKIDRRAIYERDGGLCGFCGQSVPLEVMHLDHYPIPRGLGGLTVADNLRPAHRRCNIVAGQQVNKERRAKGLPSQDGVVTVRDVPWELWHRVRVAAATEGVTIRELFIGAIREYLEQEAAADRATPKPHDDLL